jgi:hypothetical protein
MNNELKKPTFECSRYKNGKLYMFTRKKITVVKMIPPGATVDAVKQWPISSSEPVMYMELYDTFCVIETLPDFDHPFNDDGSDLAVIHEMAPRGVIRILSDFNVVPEDELLNDIIKGKIYVCEMFEPSKGILLVMRNGYGWSWSFTSGEGSEYVCHQAQKLIDEWIEKVVTMNFSRDISGQMYFEFEQGKSV